MSSDESLTDEENFDTELLVRNFEQEAQLLINNLLPQKSKNYYIKAYDNFMTWKNKNNATFEENVLLVYFEELSQTVKPPSLWSTWSKLKTTLQIHENVNIDTYDKLKKYLINKNKGYKPRKSSTLSLAQINQFINEADNYTYLAKKAIAIVAFFGCLRCQEILNLKFSDFIDADGNYIVTVDETKTDITRNFVISKQYYDIVKEYSMLRPKDFKNSDRFFINYQKGKCIHQFIGKNKISEVPKIIANFLQLPNPENYTGHCFRRSSATALSNAGANLVMVKHHGGWKSDKVAQGYVDFSTAHRKQIFDIISETHSTPQKHFLNHPPIKHTFGTSRPAVRSTNIGHSLDQNNANAKIISELEFTKTDDTNQSTFSSRINEKNNLQEDNICELSTSENQNNTDTFVNNNESVSLSDEYDNVLANIALDDGVCNKENQKNFGNCLLEKNVTIQNQNLNIEVKEPKSKKVKSNPESERDVNQKALFQNCDIQTVNINHNYYCSCEKK